MQLVASRLISELYTAALDAQDVSLLKLTINRRFAIAEPGLFARVVVFNATRQLFSYSDAHVP